MRGIVKRIMGFMTAATVFLGTLIPVYASEVILEKQKCSLNICVYDMSAAKKGGVDIAALEASEGVEKKLKNMQEYAMAGARFSYLKVSDILQTTTPENIEMYFCIDQELAELIGAGSATPVNIDGQIRDCYTSGTLNKAMADKLKGADRELKEALEEYITEKNGVAMGETDTNGRIKASNLEPGLYIVVETAVPDQVYKTANPFFIQLPMTNAAGDAWIYDVYAYPKNQTDFPTLEKKVRNKTTGGDYGKMVSASIGDVIGYRITGKLPTITTPATYLTEYSITDNVEEQVSFTQNGISASISANKGVKLDDADYDVVVADNAFTFTLTSSGLSKLNRSGGKSITIEYTGKLTSKPVLGDKGMLNTASLTYKRTNASYSETIGDGAKVYSYGIKITTAHKEAEEVEGTEQKDPLEEERKKIRDKIKELEDKIDRLEDSAGADDETAADRRERERRIRELERQIENLEYNESMLDRSSKYSTSKKGGDSAEFDSTMVKFSLKNEGTGKYVTVTGGNGIYTVSGAADTPTEFSAAADGIINVTGMGAGSYILTQTQTSEGYVLPEAATIIKINATEDNITGYGVSYTKSETGNTVAAARNKVSVSNKSGASGTVNGNGVGMLESNGSENAIVPLTIENNSETLAALLAGQDALSALAKSGLLPQTGEYGIYYMTVIGVALGIFGSIILVGAKRHRRRKK